MSILPETPQPTRRAVLAGIGGAAALTAAGTMLTGAPAGAAAPVTPGGAPLSDGADARKPGFGQPDPATERKIDALIAKMTLTEKLGQLQLVNTADLARAALKTAQVGGVFSVTDSSDLNELQHLAVNHTRLGIPLIFGLDVIHGYVTNFPIPLAQASSFDPSVAYTDATVAAAEARASGQHWTYAPMMDVSHEPRWGRISEGNGEDPYLTSQFAVAKTQGFQGTDYSAPDRLAACAKHYVAYGQPEGGRDYNTTDMSIQRLHNFYLPPFKATVEAGVATVMTSFNALNGVPSHGNVDTVRDILKGTYGFDGFVVSDYTGIEELIPHGLAANGRDAAREAMTAGIDMEMVSANYVTYGAQLLAAGRITMQEVEDAVRRILRIKFRLGLFDDPFMSPSRAVTKISAANAKAARHVATRSMVLLQNHKVGGAPALPLGSDVRTVALIGPLGQATTDLNGSWAGLGPLTPPVSIQDGLTNAGKTVVFSQGCNVNDSDTSMIAAAVRAARAADVAVLAVGETADMSGEAASRANIGLPGVQLQLVQAVARAARRTVVVLINGRPLTIAEVLTAAPAVLEAWAPGSEGGNAIADVLTGKVSPGGKLPVTFPRAVGQVPIYYNHENTGRPPDPTNKYTSKYLDLPIGPQLPFGFGLSYTTFELSNLRLSSQVLKRTNGTIDVSVDVTNTGRVKGDEVVQLYIHDPVADIVQPVRRLRGFERVTLTPRQTETVTFRMTPADVGYYDNDAHFVVEQGSIEVYVGTSSDDDRLSSEIMVS
jgi:beta-glucosidase